MQPAERSLIDQADRAAGAGDLAGARELLKRAGEGGGSEAVWLRLAAVERAAGRPRAALVAVDRALAFTPRDFAALLLRASLLQRLDDPQAGEAWGHALAQQPAGELPPQFAPVLAEARERHAAWLSEREMRLAASMTAVEQSATPDERDRIARFRSNVLRKTRPYHSEPTHYHFPALPEREFHPRSLFPWLDRLEAATDVIAEELKAVMMSERAELVPYIQYDDHLPMDQWKPLNRNRNWTAIHLLDRGRPVSANVEHCPRSMALLSGLPQPQVPGASPNAMFSLLAPNTAIPPHVGVSNTRLVCHLPLIVPEGCWFRVGAETRYWQRGQAFVFDDTIEHEALNPTDQLRVVFIFDVWAPELTAAEREAVTALMAADGQGPGGL
ncbi:aspartyl/asparaginyl beta-hydroxylase domain-containing protein [Sphingomonas arenae]|uniref:aspartyl/asparaginyl beta-hydroxylase domain-containing protein n=1 Tax=Sphingomonas arenae TaxID=2812555 RepID=UPI001F2A73AA|nr:aspartyl/asparaginyl beta-hydroxylase domain-containing protein [Sphingomonas arenae]